MKLTRNNIFETNSSSTHTIAITKKYKDDIYNDHTGVWDIENFIENQGSYFEDENYNFDRCPFRICDCWDEKLAYMYIVLRSRIEEKDHYYKDMPGCRLITKDDFENFKEMVRELQKELQEKPKFSVDDLFKALEIKGEYGYSIGYVDHDYEVPKELVEKCISDKEFLKRFIFCKDSYIVTSGDEYNGYYIKTIGFEYDYEDHYKDDSEFNKKLKEYQKDYEIYFKGN